MRTVVGSHSPERTDLAALVIGPSDLGLGADGTLYVADTLGNRTLPFTTLLRFTSGGAGQHRLPR